MQSTDLEVGGERARTACVRGDHTYTPEKNPGGRETLFPEERGLKMRQGTGPQSVSWGAISKEMRLRIQAPESFVSWVFLLWFFFWVIL